VLDYDFQARHLGNSNLRKGSLRGVCNMLEAKQYINMHMFRRAVASTYLATYNNMHMLQEVFSRVWNPMDPEPSALALLPIQRWSLGVARRGRWHPIHVFAS